MPVPWTDVTYAHIEGLPLLARVYRDPSRSMGAPAVVEVHGGSWSSGDRSYGVRYCNALAERGLVVASIDFRQGPEHHHPAGSDDVAAAVEWLRSEADDHGVDPTRVALVGSSSGGHLALLAACALVDVACVAALWPPVDPYARYRFAVEQSDHGPEELRPLYRALRRNGESYFGSESAMQEAAIARIVRAGEAKHLPPVWVARPTADANVPEALITDLVDAWRSAGGDIVVTEYPCEPHAFGHRPGPMADQLVDDLHSFLRTHL